MLVVWLGDNCVGHISKVTS